MNPIDAVDDLLERANELLSGESLNIHVHNVFKLSENIYNAITGTLDVNLSLFVVEINAGVVYVSFKINDTDTFLVATSNEINCCDDIKRVSMLLYIHRRLVKLMVSIRKTNYSFEMTNEIISMLGAINDFLGFPMTPDSIDKASDALQRGAFGEKMQHCTAMLIMTVTTMAGMVNDDDIETIAGKASRFYNMFYTLDDGKYIAAFNDTLANAGTLDFYIEKAEIVACNLFTESDDAALLILTYMNFCDRFNQLIDKYENNIESVINNLMNI